MPGMRLDARRIVPVIVVILLALGVTGLVLLVRDTGDGDGDGERASASSSTTTTSLPTTTTSGVTTTTPTSPSDTSPPATTAAPPGTVVVLPTLPPVTTKPPATSTPPNTAAGDPSDTSTTTTTARTTSTTAPDADDDDDGATDRETIVYSPEGAPKRKGDLVVPEEHGSTAIVLVHGGGGTRGSRRQLEGWGNGYAEAGYVTLSIDYFLFADSTPPPVWPVPERDVKAAVQYLRENATKLDIDPDRILLQGFSSGAALGSVAYVNGDAPEFAGPGLYDDTSDVVDGFIGFYGAYEGNRADPAQYCGGPSDILDLDVQACYELSDAVALASDASGPALLFHGDADDTLPPEGTTAFAAALTGAGKDVGVVMVEGADHSFDRTRRSLTPEGEEALARIVEWLEEEFPEGDAAAEPTTSSAAP
jgi:acetyl esterase/lipase